MKKVVIKNNFGSVISQAELDDPMPWIGENQSVNAWGLPERWQEEFKSGESPQWVKQYDPQDVIGREERDIGGKGILSTWVKLRADYTIEITDITYENDLKNCLAKRIAEYPTIDEFMDAFFDGGMDDLIQRRLDIKSKYPLPE